MSTTAPQLDAASLAARLQLVSRAVSAQSEDPDMAHALAGLHKIIKNDLVALTSSTSPAGFTSSYFELEQELERFREFCAFPALAQKVLVAFGGGFSAGKSTLINTLLGSKLLVADTNPTTALPTYLLRGASDAICALNLHRHRIDLSEAEFASLTHEEQQLYGSSVARLLQSAFITRSNFPWHNIAFIDTPGYSKPESSSWTDRTDAQVARTQLNMAQLVVWAVSVEAGTISEDDLLFLASLRTDIPKIIAITRADKVAAPDVAKVVALVTDTLAQRNIPVQAVIPVSRSARSGFGVEPLLAYVQEWDQRPQMLRFAHNFKRPFTQFARYLDEARREESLRMNRLNRVLLHTDADGMARDIEELKALSTLHLDSLQSLDKTLLALRNQFFKNLKAIGDKVGIPLPEPEELDLVDVQAVDLLALLRSAREARKQPTPDYRHCWAALAQTGQPPNRAHLLRTNSLSKHGSRFALLSDASFIVN